MKRSLRLLAFAFTIVFVWTGPYTGWRTRVMYMTVFSASVLHLKTVGRILKL